jgi:cytochrome c peroxidase
MISGVRGDAETAVRAGIRFIQFAVRPEEDAEAIDAYLRALRPVPSPWLENGELSEAAKRGRDAYDRAGCAACHSGPFYTDLHPYDVGTGTGREEGMAYDTPTLIEVWRTAPYLHDGRSATMEDVLTTHNPEDQHGKTSGLTPEELRDLAAYVNSL